MKRRSFAMAMILSPLTCAVRARAQGSTATQLQIDLALAFVSLAALRTRYGEAHPDVATARGRAAALDASLRAASLRGEEIDVAAATHALELELADVRVRLAEFSQRCGSGHPDMQSAHARAAALETAIAVIMSDGIFFPPG